jgi:hypothetical protein
MRALLAMTPAITMAAMIPAPMTFGFFGPTRIPLLQE